jgi:hypothetical protein
VDAAGKPKRRGGQIRVDLSLGRCRDFGHPFKTLTTPPRNLNLGGADFRKFGQDRLTVLSHRRFDCKRNFLRGL